MLETTFACTACDLILAIIYTPVYEGNAERAAKDSEMSMFVLLASGCWAPGHTGGDGGHVVSPHYPS